MKEFSPSTPKSNKGREIVAKMMLVGALGMGLMAPSPTSAESPIKLTDAMYAPTLDEKETRLMIVGIVALLGWTTLFGHDKRRDD